MALLPDHRIATLVAGLVTLAAGAVLVGLAPRSPLHRAAGLFFGLRGASYTLTAFSTPFDDLQGRLAVYALLAIPFAAIWMALRLQQDFGYRRRSPRLLRWWAVGLATVCASLLLAYALDHALYFGHADRRGPLGWFFQLQFVAYAAIAMVIRREHRRRPQGPSRHALASFALGFAAEPAYWGAYILSLQSTPSYGGLDAAAAFAAISLGLALASVPWHDPGSDRRTAVGVLAAAIATGSLTVLNAHRGFAPPYTLTLPTANAVWTLWTVGATAYASLRYHLFGIDLRVKAFLRFGSTTFLLAIVFWLASEVIEAQLDANNLLQSLAIAAVVAAALYPLQLLTKRLAERWMPGVANTEDYRRRRREDIYLAAVERARVDGFVDDAEREALRMLGHGLGLSGRDMNRLEKAATA